MKIRLRRALMGNHKFRFSDMMPNAWFYKLRDMSRTSSKHPNSSSHSATKKKQSSNCQKQSYLYFSNPPKRQNRFSNSPVHSTSKNSLFQESSPRKSFYKKRVKRQTIYKPSSKNVSSSSVSDGCSCHSRINSVRAHDKRSNLCTQDSSNYLLSALESSSESFSSDDQIPFCLQSSDCKISTSRNDIIIHMNNHASTKKKFNEIGRFDKTVSQIELPPIQTKTEKLSYSSSEIKEIKKRSVSYEVSKTQKKNPRTANSPGIKLRVNSPKIQVSARKSISKSQRKGISDSFAVVKSSVDPRRDFRESMVEMIAENNIRASRDMEDLLACYLSLNSDEYHDLIIEAFKQIWFDMKNLHL